LTPLAALVCWGYRTPPPVERLSRSGPGGCDHIGGDHMAAKGDTKAGGAKAARSKQQGKGGGGDTPPGTGANSGAAPKKSGRKAGAAPAKKR